MANWLDIIGSILIGILIIFLIMKLNYQVSTNSTEITSNGMVQGYLTTIGSVMENDIYKIGYRISDPNKLNIADSNRFSFKADINNDGTLDSVRYYFGTTSQAGKTSNPNDKPLFKVLNGGTPVRIGFIRDCRFTYYDSTGRQILSYGASATNSDTLKKVRLVNVYFKCESPYLINKYYQSAEYSRKIKPVNLK